MSKNLTRKGLALGTSLALGITGLVGIAAPAYAAGEVISIAPTTGNGWGSYNDETLSATVKIDRNIVTELTTATINDNFAIEVTQADSKDVTVNLLAETVLSTLTGDLTTGVCAVTFPVKLSNGVTSVDSTAVTSFVSADANTDAECLTDDGLNDSLAFTIDFTPSTVKYTSASFGIADNFVAASFDINVGTSVSDDNSSVGITAWNDKDNDLAREADDLYPSTTETINFYDSTNVSALVQVERFSYDEDGLAGPNAADGDEVDVLNADGNPVLGASVAFTPALNLDQVSFSNITFGVSVDSADATTQIFTPRGLNGVSNHSKAGKIYGTIATVANLVKDKSYLVSLTKSDTVNKVSVAGGYTVPVQQDLATDITAISSIGATPANDNKQDDTADKFQLRPGVKEFTYTAVADAAKANVPVLAKVRPTVLATESTFTVGSTTYAANQIAWVSGTTDAAGKFAVKVTSSTAKSDEAYKIEFFALGTAGTWITFNSGTPYTATYATTAVTTITSSATIIAGANPAVNFTVKDQFGQLVSVSDAGKALVVEVKASNTTNLKKYVPVSNGVAALTFANYLAVGASDSISWSLGTLTGDVFTGESVSNDSGSIQLFNPAAAAGVNAVASQTANITYDDFITGTASATNVAPDQAADVAITGTVVDANGYGIPGAVVTLAAKGVQFQKTGGDYFVDSITTSADAAGAFSVNVWAHTVSSTGIPVTITSGGKTATTLLKTYLPSAGVNGDNLVFSVNLPAVVVKNTTYAVTAKLTDKWGNPIQTITGTDPEQDADGATNAGVAGVTFQGSGSVEINSLSTAVAKNFDKNGMTTVFLRSVKDVAGPGSLTATLGIANYSATSAATAKALAVTEITTDVTATKWNETVFKNTVETNIEVLESAPAPAASSNASGSTGKFYASATNAAGKKVVVKVNGVFAKSFIGTTAKKVISVTASKGTKTITIFVGGKLSSTKVVIVK